MPTRCPQCRAPSGTEHKMSCSDPRAVERRRGYLEGRRQAEAETVDAIVAWHRSEADHCEAERRVEETLSGGLVMVSTFEVRRDQHIQAADAIERRDFKTTEEGQG